MPVRIIFCMGFLALIRGIPAWLAGLLLAVLLVSGCGGSGSSATTTSTAAARYPSSKSPPLHVPSGQPPKKVVVKEVKKGTGPAVPPVTTLPKVKLDVLYTAVKWNGELFEERQNPRDPFEVEFGAHLNPGWEDGLEGMRVGGRRELIVPVSASWGTGSDEALVYVVDLISLKRIGHPAQPVDESRTSPESPEREPTVRMSKAEIDKLPPLKGYRPTGPPPKHLEVIDLRKGSGATVDKADVVAIRFTEDTYPQALAGRQGALSKGIVHWPSWSLATEASRGIRLGLPGAKVGGRRVLIVPPKVAYPHWKPSWGYAPYVSVYVVDVLGAKPGR